MPALDGLTGIVLAVIFGSVFIITCIISAVKAVRDRSRIKKRRAAREKEKLGNVDKKNDVHSEDISPTSHYDSYYCQPSCSGNNRLSNGTTCSSGSVEHLDLSVYSIGAGVDNLTFEHINTNTQYAKEKHLVSPQKLKADTETVPSCQSLEPRRVRSNDANFHRERNLESQSTEFLSAEKILRRRSYEVAVCENSWLSQELPCVSPLQTILDALNNKKNVENSTKALKVAFENQAYDTDDSKKT